MSSSFLPLGSVTFGEKGLRDLGDKQMTASLVCSCSREANCILGSI